VNFWTALIFASLYQDKEGRKKVNTNEGEAYKDSVLELHDFYNCVGSVPEAISRAIARRP
jgi:hypothetical protein